MTSPTFNTVAVYYGSTLTAHVKVDADLPTDDQLEQAFTATQNINGSWSRGTHLPDGTRNRDFNPFVTVVAPLPRYLGEERGHRSSSVGDGFLLITPTERTMYRVEGCGFAKVAGVATV